MDKASKQTNSQFIKARIGEFRRWMEDEVLEYTKVPPPVYSVKVTTIVYNDGTIYIIHPEFDTICKVKMDGQTYFHRIMICKLLGYQYPLEDTAGICQDVRFYPNENYISRFHAISKDDVRRLVDHTTTESLEEQKSWVLELLAQAEKEDGELTAEQDGQNGQDEIDAISTSPISPTPPAESTTQIKEIAPSDIPFPFPYTSWIYAEGKVTPPAKFSARKMKALAAMSTEGTESVTESAEITESVTESIETNESATKSVIVPSPAPSTEPTVPVEVKGAPGPIGEPGIANPPEVIEVFCEVEVLGRKFNVYGTAENPLFVARDVAEWIEYGKTGAGKYDVSTMLQKVDEDEKGTNIIRTPGGPQSVWCLTYDGLSEVLMQSRKPIAKQFKREIKKILHNIRKHGMYISDSLFERPDFLKEAVDRYVAEHHMRKQLEAEKIALLPKVEYHDDILNAPGLNTVISIAKNYPGMTAQWLNKFLHYKGIQYKVYRVNECPLWVLYKDCSAMGLAQTVNYNGKKSTQWSNLGEKFIYDLLKEIGIRSTMHCVNGGDREITLMANEAVLHAYEALWRPRPAESRANTRIAKELIATAMKAEKISTLRIHYSKK